MQQSRNFEPGAVPVLRMPITVTRNFGVLGSPINHSQSPALHRAAISTLGIDATYTSTEVTGSELPGFIKSLGDSWTGLSLTMPLKNVIRPMLARECATSTLTGSVNTVVRRSNGWEGYNTDVWGATTAMRRQWGTDFSSAIILGAGATASSLVVSLRDLGVESLVVVARDLSRTRDLQKLCRELGIDARTALFGEVLEPADIVVSSLPSTAVLSPATLDCLNAVALFDVVYQPWPSALGQEWGRRGLESISGLHMLLWQAVRQARVFYGDSVDEPLPNEELVVTAMRAAVGL
ncbi:MAG: shikimate dehydrogenase [Actinobacteria bacterium]|nr:shikimate dehydrogenase [Actinomycetota bacterium]